jgi:hypothetical protein
MPTYRPEGQPAFSEFAAALAEEHAIAHELAQCAKIDAYHLLASDLYDRMTSAHSASLAAFKKVESFKS